MARLLNFHVTTGDSFVLKSFKTIFLTSFKLSQVISLKCFKVTNDILSLSRFCQWKNSSRVFHFLSLDPVCFRLICYSSPTLLVLRSSALSVLHDEITADSVSLNNNHFIFHFSRSGISESFGWVV